MRRKTSGNTCARPISPTACSKTTPQSSTLASSHGVAFSTSSVASSPSPAVIGLLQVNHSEVWYYFTAEKRLSNEFAGTIGCEPATMLSFAAGASAAAVSESNGVSGGGGAGAGGRFGL